MYNPREILNKEPVVVAGALSAVLNVLVLLGVIAVDGDQLAAINTATVLVFALFVRSKVTPV